jgi:hypothetical protein
VNLRTIEKKLSRGKRRKCQQTERYRAKTVDKEGNFRNTLLRGSYFTSFRAERQLLNILSKNPPELDIKKDRTNVRRLYYRTLPFLFSRLSYHRDRQILNDIERYYYGYLTTVKLLRNEAPNRVSRLNWELRSYTSAERISLSKHKL